MGFSLFQLGHDSDSCSVILEPVPSQKYCFRLSYSNSPLGCLKPYMPVSLQAEEMSQRLYSVQYTALCEKRQPSNPVCLIFLYKNSTHICTETVTGIFAFTYLDNTVVKLGFYYFRTGFIASFFFSFYYFYRMKSPVSLSALVKCANGVMCELSNVSAYFLCVHKSLTDSLVDCWMAINTWTH